MVLRVAILGAGISGLSLGWFLQKKYRDNIQLTIIEKTNRPGGWIRSLDCGGFLFEKGPRSCRTKGNGIFTLQLLEELGLANQTIRPHSSAKKRYICYKGQLEPVPYSVGSFLTFPLWKELLKGAWKDLFTGKSPENDESIYSFISRRLTPRVMESLFDPLVTGIYAGDPKKLSLRACFPTLYQWEQSQGSLLKGAFFGKKPVSNIELTPFIQEMQAHSLFSLKKGLETLPCVLAEKLQTNILFSQTVQGITFDNQAVQISLADRPMIEADYVFSAIPAHALADLLCSQCKEGASLLRSIPFASVAVVNLGFSQRVSSLHGFGYLIPSNEREKVLGVVWDSCVFPQQNRQENETRLTVMIGESRLANGTEKSEQELLQISLEAIRKHMGIAVAPDVWHVEIMQQAIPQYLVGHVDKLAGLKAILSKLSDRLQLMGSSYMGVSVNDCIAEAKEMVNSSAMIC